jgi:hypothetical protein
MPWEMRPKNAKPPNRKSDRLQLIRSLRLDEPVRRDAIYGFSEICGSTGAVVFDQVFSIASELQAGDKASPGAPRSTP